MRLAGAQSSPVGFRTATRTDRAAAMQHAARRQADAAQYRRSRPRAALLADGGTKASRSTTASAPAAALAGWRRGRGIELRE